MNHIMLDLETLGTQSDATIVSIGAVFFDPYTGEIGAEFELSTDIASVIGKGSIDGDTLAWWFKQPDEVRHAVLDNSYGYEDMLIEFGDWVMQIENISDRIVWGNGADFDNVILANALSRSFQGQELWKYYNNRDVRTIVELGRQLLNFDPKKDMPFEGERHTALADAKHQAKYVSAIIQRLKGAVINQATA